MSAGMFCRGTVLPHSRSLRMTRRPMTADFPEPGSPVTMKVRRSSRFESQTERSRSAA